MLRVEGLVRLHIGPVDFEVADGACLAITGASGSGKSLLLRAVADLDPNDGRAATSRLQRETVAAPDWRRAVTLLPAESGWWADGVAAHFRDPQAQTPLLGRIALPEAAMGWDVARLSSGERHRLALLRALEQGPEVLLLDEPTAALDREATGLVEAFLKARMADGLSLVLVTHDADQPGRLGADTVRLEGGRLMSEAAA